MSQEPFGELELLLKIISLQIQKMSQEKVEDINSYLDDLLKILGNATRRKILTRLSIEEAYVNQLIEELDQHPQAVIRHLESLKGLKLVTTRQINQDGKGRPRVYYQITGQLASRETPLQKNKTQRFPESDFCLVFPRLNFLKQQLQFTDSPKRLKQIIEEIEASIGAHEQAITQYKLLKETTLSKIKKIAIE